MKFKYYSKNITFYNQINSFGKNLANFFNICINNKIITLFYNNKYLYFYN